MKLALAVGEEFGHGRHAFDQTDVDDGFEEVGTVMETRDAEGVGEEISFAEEAGGGGDVGEVVEMDGCGGGEVFGFGEGGGEGVAEGLELGLGEGDEGRAGEGFSPEVGLTVCFAGRGVVVEVFVSWD